MVAALLTTLFFSFSAIFAARSIRHVGATVANLGRLGVAFVCLGTYAHLAGLGLGGAGRDMFLWSGVVGMGLGDLALFAALPLLGSRLTVLVAQCVAVPVAMLAEWLWLDTRLAGAEVLWATVILAGVAVALMPSKSHPPRVPVRLLGLIMGLLAAVGQGLGAVMSRRAYEITTLAGDSIDGITAAYQRITGGLVITLLFFAGRAVWRHWRAGPAATTEAVPPPPGVSGARWCWMGVGFIVANALAGPVIGVSCYQWALASTPSGIVLPIVATTPLVIIPLSYWIEGERPTRRSLAGGVVAVLGVVALTLVR